MNGRKPPTSPRPRKAAASASTKEATKGLESSIENGGAQERGSAIDDCCAEELGSIAGGAHDLDSGFDNDVAQEGSRGVGDAGVGYKKRLDDDGWFVETNHPDHNHLLSDNCGEKMQWNSHKKIDQATKDTVRYLRENNVSLSKVHCILGSMHKSGDRLPFTKKLLRTICQQIAFDQKDDDIKKTIDLFRSMRSTDPDFAFRFDLDPEGRIKNLIWTSGRSRRQYTCFGDVVVFDTSYTTNLYKMPFGLFVGVNNHFQTVIYAGILMSEETIEGFNWAYKEFVSLMGGKAPSTMLTDQCRAMEVAIGMTLPGTVHRWCKWHVFRKAKEELGGIFSKKTGFKDAFNNVVNEMLTIDEFEKAWGRLIEDFGLVENSFMIRAFEARHKWAKPYFKDKYCARMTSTQRVESANHMLKTYVPRNSSMNKFVSQCNKLLKDRNEAEDSEEHKNKQLMIHFGLNQIPDFHIMKRWTKSVRDILGPNVEGPSDTEVSLPKSFRHNIMYVSALELVKMGDLAESRSAKVTQVTTRTPRTALEMVATATLGKQLLPSTLFAPDEGAAGHAVGEEQVAENMGDGAVDFADVMVPLEDGDSSSEVGYQATDKHEDGDDEVVGPRRGFVGDGVRNLMQRRVRARLV
ncbi:hypothetical protein ACQ4PT_066373 [Festuca glaucescens]